MADRLLLGIAALAGMAAIAGSALGAPRLTDRNSINPAFRHHGFVTIDGTGCGASASAADPVPEGATGVKVLAPKVGDRATGARVTEVRLDGRQITVTAVGDGPEMCDPDFGAEPPATRRWSATFNNVTATYRRRLQTLIRTNFTASRPKFRLAPRTVYTERIGSGYGKVVHIRWKRFGSKRATGSGVFKERPAGIDNNKRVTLVAWLARYCVASRKYEYQRLNVRTRSHLVRAIPAYCG